jgi:Uma2 family endonuclease
MATTRAATQAPPPIPTPLDGARTIADLLERLGNVPPHRVRLHPTPGTATEKDVIKAHDREKRLCELVVGTLVEKTVGVQESMLAFVIGHFLIGFVRPRKLGIVTGPDGAIRLFPGLVRIPDVAFISRGRLPGGKVPKEPIPELAPDLVVVVLSKSNTKAEMARKLKEYFSVGVRLAWMVDPKTRTVRVHTAADRSVLLQGDEALDGGEVLPGFSLRLSELFEEDEPGGGAEGR